VDFIQNNSIYNNEHVCTQAQFAPQYGRKIYIHLKILLQKLKLEHSYGLFIDLFGALFSKVTTLVIL
jgi:hypothetical protein